MIFVFGGILIAAGVVLTIIRSSQASKLSQMKELETSRAGDLVALAADVASEIGGGAFTQIAELKGRSFVESPLKSELAGTDCVYYRMSVNREYEETYWENDDKGNRVRRTRRGSDLVAHNERSVPFYIDDGSGRVLVRPEGASFVAEKAFSRFEPGEPAGGRLAMGALSLVISGAIGGRMTLGYRYEEDLIPVGCELYVLGEAADEGGELAMRKPADKKRRFIISVKSEEELTKRARTTIIVLTVIAAVCAVGGIGLLIAAAHGAL